MLTQKEMEKQRQAVHEGGKHNCTKEKGKAMTNIYIYNLQVYKSRGGGYMLHNVKKGKATVKQKGGGSIVETIIIQNH